MGYTVTSHLVIAKDQTGRLHHKYRGDGIPWLSDEQREHFLAHGLVAEDGVSVVESVADQGDQPSGDKPLNVAPKADWVAWGVANGHNQAELEALAKQELVELLG